MSVTLEGNFNGLTVIHSQEFFREMEKAGDHKPEHVAILGDQIFYTGLPFAPGKLVMVSDYVSDEA